MTKKAVLITIDPDVHEWAKKHFVEQGKSFSGEVNSLLTSMSSSVAEQEKKD